MAITLQSGSETRQTGGIVSSFTVSIDAGSGSNRLLTVAIFQRGALQAVTAITYNSVAMTQAVNADETSTATDLRAEIFYLVAPTTGSNTLSVTFAGGTTYECQAAVWNGGKQSSPLDQTGTDTSTAGTAPSVSLTPAENNELLFGAVIHEAATALTTGTGETVLYNNDNGAWVTSTSYAIQTTATTQAVDWTAGTSLNYAAAAASFKEEAAAAGRVAKLSLLGAG